jgi:16S rRNA processing protein RimM
MDWEEMATVGCIARAHGNRGHVIVDPQTDFPAARFRPSARMFIRRGATIQEVRLTSVRFHRNRPEIGIDGIETMNDAQGLRGCELRVPVGELTPLPSGTFYHHDLVGCRVETPEGRLVGTVRGVEGGAAGSRLVVEAGAAEILVPFAGEICTTIDPAARRIVIDPPEGLLELNAPKGSM